MTLHSAWPRVVAFVRSPWALVALVSVVALTLTCRLNAGRDAEREARRLAEAERLRAQGVVVAAQRDVADMRETLAAAVSRSRDLAAEVDRVKRAARGARPVSVSSLSTGPVPAAGTARPAEPSPSSGSAPPAAGPCSCLLAPGDLGEIRADSVTLETRGGNRVLAAAASAWRVSPGPETRLFGGPLRGDFAIAAERPPPGWGVGGFGAVCGAGWLAGPVAALPPARIWRWQVETQLGAGFGSAGFGATSAALVRW